MGKDSKIGWTHHTFNIVWGCQKVSEECDNCYAETFSKRVGLKVWGPPKTTERRVLSDKYWKEPVLWDRMARDAGERHRVFLLVDGGRVRGAPDGRVAARAPVAADRRDAEPRLAAAHQAPAEHHAHGPGLVAPGIPRERLGRHDGRQPEAVRRALAAPARGPGVRPVRVVRAPAGAVQLPRDAADYLHWGIVGGETGPDGVRREMDVDHACYLLGQLHGMGIPPFLKQDSGRSPGQQGRFNDELWGYKEFPGMAR